MTDITFPNLQDLNPIAYINGSGQLPEEFQGKVGVYAIFDGADLLQYIGYSRDVFLSLKQHLIRQPEKCVAVKVQTIDRPSRTALDEICQAWIEAANQSDLATIHKDSVWTQSIDVKTQLTDEEQAKVANAIDDLEKSMILKKACRRVEAIILDVLKARGLETEIRFNPKLKESGLLDLK